MSDLSNRIKEFPIDKETKEGYSLFLDILSKDNGYSILRSANVMYALKLEVANLTQQELIFFTQRINEAASMSYYAFYTEDRTNGLITLLNRHKNVPFLTGYEMPDLSCEEIKDFLISCDDETFTDLIDYVTYCCQDYLKPDPAPELEHINDIIAGYKENKNKRKLSKMIDNARERTIDTFYSTLKIEKEY